MRRLHYGQMTDGQWQVHGDPACATRREREQPEDGWKVTLQPFPELAEELRAADAAVGEATRMLLCSCLGTSSGGRRPVAAAPAYDPEW
ncbi:hypothetical protein [Streptomyces albogriseolus]|uniref:hypothetical protein n=1 Tax=Streptomyces albogriseolus TaxID=1887 RepID=UPI00345F5227